MSRWPCKCISTHLFRFQFHCVLGILLVWLWYVFLPPPLINQYVKYTHNTCVDVIILALWCLELKCCLQPPQISPISSKSIRTCNNIDHVHDMCATSHSSSPGDEYYCCCDTFPQLATRGPCGKDGSYARCCANILCT